MYKIAISGKAGTGKDTLSNMLWSEFSLTRYLTMMNLIMTHAPRHACTYVDEKFTRKNIAFADPIKEMILHMYPQIERNFIFGPSINRNAIISGSFKNEQPLTIRKLLQEFGEGCKQYNPKIWVEAFDHAFTQCEREKIDLVVASDLRFIDEFNYLKEKKFYLIRLIKNDVAQMSHISETQQELIKDEEFDIVINNNGTLEDLKKQVKEVVKILMS